MQGGEELALMARLYSSHAEALLRFCYRLCGDADLAQDLLMETIQAAPKAIRRFEKRSTVKTWLYRIALNKWREASRRLARLEPMREVPVASADRDLALVVEAEMALLSEPLFEAFALVRLEGLKYREAAAILEVPVGTVQSRVHAACEQLRSRLEGLE